MPDLTAQQQKFVDHLVSTGCTPTEAARVAGYEHPTQESYRLIRKPHVNLAIRELRERVISSDLANVATATLRAVMLDEEAPASARVSAARTAYEAAGHLGKNAGAGEGRDKPLSEMSEAELVAFIA